MAEKIPQPHGGALNRFVKGESGNPKGRPRKLPEIEVLLEKILSKEKDGVTVAEGLLTKLVNMALSGNLNAIKLLLDRAYGEAKKRVEFDLPDSSEGVKVSWVIEVPKHAGDETDNVKQ